MTTSHINPVPEEEPKEELMLVQQLELSRLLIRSQKCQAIKTDSQLLGALELITELTSRRGQAIQVAKEMMEPYQAYIDTIKGAINRLLPLEGETTRLRALVAEYEGLKKRAQVERAEELEKQANEKRAKALKAKTHNQRLELLDAEFKLREKAQAAIQPTPGVAVRLGWSATLLDWVVVANSNPQLLKKPEISLLALQDFIRAQKNAGITVTEDMIPGIKLTPTNSITIR